MISSNKVALIWGYSPIEIKPDSIARLFDRGGDFKLFWEKIQERRAYFESASRIVEIGAGECWGTCALKAIFPHKTIIATDTSHTGLASAPYWEHVLRVRLDGVTACSNHELPFENESVDLIFAFQSAHHFVRHRRGLAELKRVLTRGGHALYLHEPSSRRLWYPLRGGGWSTTDTGPQKMYYFFPRIRSLAIDQGFVTQIHFVPTTTNKMPLSMAYFFLLSKFPPLRRVLPCIMDLVLTAPKAD